MKLKKSFAWLLALAMSATVAPAAFAEGESYPQISANGGILEMEEVFPTASTTDNPNAHGGKLVYEGWTDRTVYEGKFIAAENGSYTVDFFTNRGDAGITSSGAVLTIDGIAVVDAFASNDFREIEAVYPDPDYFPIRDFYGESAIYLSAGEHDIKVVYTVPGSAGSIAKYASDYIQFTKLAAVTLPESGVLEFDEFYGVNTNVYTADNASGGKYVYNPYGASNLNRYHENTVIVPEGGLYDLHFLAGVTIPPAYVSLATVKIDDVAVLNNQSDPPAIEPYYPANEFYYMADHVSSVTLTAGAHKLSVEYSPAYSNNDGINYSADCIKLIKKPLPKIEAAGGTLEFSDLFDADTSGSADASGGEYYAEGNGTQTSFTGSFTVAEAGSYDVNFFVTSEAAATTMSEADLYIDGMLTNDSSEHINDAPEVFNAMYGFYIKNIPDCRAIYLSEGVHTVEIQLTSHAGGVIKFAADCIKFTKRAAIPASGTMELENLFGVNNFIVDNENASGGKIVHADWAPVAEFGGDITVPEDGSYLIDFVGSKAGGNPSISYGKLCIDGVSVLDQHTDNDNCTALYTINDWCPIVRYQPESAVWLSAGTHSVTLEYTVPAGAPNCLKWAFDTLSLTKETAVEVFTSNLTSLAEEPYWLEFGTAADQVKAYRNDVQLQNNQTYQITYQSSNPEVLAINGNGELDIGGKIGTSTISVIISRNGIQVGEDSVVMYVIDDEINYITNATYQDGKVSFTVMNQDSVNFTGVAIVGVYNGSELVEAKIVDISGSDFERPYETPAANGDSIKIFVWNTIPSMAPHWVVTNVK